MSVLGERECVPNRWRVPEGVMAKKGRERNGGGGSVWDLRLGKGLVTRHLL